MAQLEGRAELRALIVIVLSEEEAGALDALAGYGTDAFLEMFYEKLGKAYLKPYESGLRSLFDSVHGGPCSVKGILDSARDAMAVFNGDKVARARE